MRATDTYSQQRPSGPAPRRPLAGEPPLPSGARAAFRAAVRRSIATVTREEDATLTCLRGAVPTALRGVLYRNGPGSVGIGVDRYRHLFDGDGHITRFELAEGEVKYRNLIPSEPVVAPRPGAQGEDDAWLLVLCYHAELDRSVLAILDVASLATVAELALPHSVPPTLHGAWIPG